MNDSALAAPRHPPLGLEGVWCWRGGGWLRLAWGWLLVAAADKGGFVGLEGGFAR